MRWRCAAGIFHRNAGELRLCCIWPSVPPETDGHSESQLVARKQFPPLSHRKHFDSSSYGTGIRTGKFAPVTLDHMRSHGCRELVICCSSGYCNHSTAMNVGHLSDDIPIKSLGDGVVCKRCGHV